MRRLFVSCGTQCLCQYIDKLLFNNKKLFIKGNSLEKKRASQKTMPFSKIPDLSAADGDDLVHLLLRLHQTEEGAAPFYQFVVRADFGDFAVFDDDQAVGIL